MVNTHTHMHKYRGAINGKIKKSRKPSIGVIEYTTLGQSCPARSDSVRAYVRVYRRVKARKDAVL